MKRVLICFGSMMLFLLMLNPAWPASRAGQVTMKRGLPGGDLPLEN
jgi:hypothetical protein